MVGETVLSRKAFGMEIDEHVSDFRVMSTGAGYYIGTVFTYCGECDACKKEGMPKGVSTPNSRETDYFKTSELAEAALEVFKVTGKLEKQRH